MRQFFAQLFEVFNNTIVNDGHGPGLMWMGVFGGGHAMGGPAGVADARLASKRLMNQKI